MRVALACIVALPLILLCVLFGMALTWASGRRTWEDLAIAVWGGLVLSAPVVLMAFVVVMGIH